jgi:hypothetical protein
MNKKVIAFIIILLVVAGAVITYALVKDKNDKTDNTAASTDTSENIARINNDELILFYGDGCPHCKIVEDYIAANNLDKKLNIQKKEVWYDKDNATELQEKGTTCGIAADNLGVPLLFDTTTNKCYVGEVDVKDLLNIKAGI